MLPSNKTQPNLMTPDRMTIPDHQIGQPTFAINFIARPGGATRHAFAEIQQRLAADLPGGVFACPLDSLHLTVVPIIWARGTYDFDVRTWWADNAGEAIDELLSFTKESPGFTLTCAGIDVLPGAIVTRFNPNPALNALREKVHDCPTFKDMLVEKIDFTHVTVFRFKKELPFSSVTKVVERLAVPKAEWVIDHLTLCQETTYPSLQCADIARMELVS